jgi:hypothetical protein
MELLTQLDLAATNDFFNTFFALPPYYWKGFLGSNLSSVQLLVFALLTFVYAPPSIKAKLVSHLITGTRGGGVNVRPQHIACCHGVLAMQPTIDVQGLNAVKRCAWV